VSDSPFPLCILYTDWVLPPTTGTDIMMLDLPGFRFVILDTYQAAVDVLINKGSDVLQR
jgi:hypothetical protein